MVGIGARVVGLSPTLVTPRARTKVFVLSLAVIFQVKIKSTSTGRFTWNLQLSTNTEYFALSPQIQNNVLSCHRTSFSFVKIFIVTHSCRTSAVILHFSPCPNRGPMHLSFRNIKLDLVLFILYPNTFEKSFIEISC